MKQIFFKKASAWLLAVCMVITMLPLNSALAATPPANGMVISSADTYARYGGSVTVHFLFEMDANGSKNYTATAGGLFQLTSSNPALLPSLRTSNFSCMNPITKSPWNIMYSESNGQIFPTALDLTSTAFDVSMRMDNVTSDPNLGIDPVERYGGAMIDVLQNGKAIQLAMSDVSIIDMPKVKFVHDMDVTIDPLDDEYPGTVTYKGRTATDNPDGTITFKDDAANTTLNKTNVSHTSQTATQEKSEFTITPDTGFEVDYATATLPNGTKQQLTHTSGSTYTFDGLSSLSAATDKVQINVKFKVADGTTRTVTFDSMGGSTVPVQTIPYNTAATKPADPTKTGYVFGGWYTERSFDNLYDFATKVRQNTTVYAKWNDGSGTAYKVEHYTQNVNGSGYELAQTENKTGTTGGAADVTARTFEGFSYVDSRKTYQDNAHTASSSVLSIAADGSLVIKLYYDRNRVTLTFVPNSATASVSPSTATGLYGASFTTPTPTNTNKSEAFGGWYEDVQCTVPYTETTLPASNKSVYAKWTTTTHKVTSSITGDNADKGTITPLGEQTVVDGNNITFNFSSQSMYGVKSIKIDGVAQDLTTADLTKYTFTNVKDDHTIELQFGVDTDPNDPTKPGDDVADSEQLTFTFRSADTNKGLVGGLGEYKTRETKTLAGQASPKTIPVVTALGEYAFSNWTSSAGTYANDAALKAASFAQDATFTANFDVKSGTTRTVTFVPNGGTAVPTQTVNYGSTATRPTDPTRAGFTFKNWYSDAACTTIYNFASAVTENITLYADWNAGTGTQYKIEHYQQNTSGSGYTLFETETAAGTTGSTVSATAKNYAGFVLNTRAPGSVLSGTVSGDGTTVLRLYYDRKTVTVTFAKNSQTATLNPSSATGLYGTALTKPTPTNSNTDLSFGGWYKDDGVFAQAFADTTFPAEDTMVFAKWNDNSVWHTVTSSITGMNSDKGSIMPLGAQKIRDGASVTFAISSDPMYGVKSIKVDGTALDLSTANLTSYTFKNVSADHTIEVQVGPDVDPNDPTKPGDDVADSEQLLFSYTTESASKGTIEGKETYLVRETKNAAGQASPKAIPGTVPAKNYSFVKWTANSTDYASNNELRNAVFSADTTITASFKQGGNGNDPIRPFDPANPTDKTPGKDDWLVPGNNGWDENGKEDDKIVKPTNPGTGDGLNNDGDLVLPNGGTIEDSTGGDKETLPPNSMVKPDGSIYYGVKINLQDKISKANLTGTAGFPSIVYVAKGSAFSQTNIPSTAFITGFIAGYTYDSSSPSPITISATALQSATAASPSTVTLFYLASGNDPIRPFDKEHPENKSPATADRDGWLVPDKNLKDEYGQGDDMIVTPNKGSDGKDNSKLNGAGELELPNGGKTDDGEILPPGTVVLPNGTIFYTVVTQYLSKVTNAAIQNEKIDRVQSTSTTAFKATLISISGYTYDSADPANYSMTVAQIKASTTQPTIKLYYYSSGNDPIRPFDKEDPTDKKPSAGDQDGWLVPGTNNKDENHATGTDDVIVTPDKDSTGKDNSKVDDDTGRLQLPDGGTMAGPDGSKDLPDGTEVEPNGTIWWPITIVLKDHVSGNAIAAPSGFQSPRPVREGSGITVSAPTIANYKLYTGQKASQTLDKVNAAQTITFEYIGVGGDPIRPYDKESPTNKQPAADAQDGWLVPATDTRDDSAASGSDDMIVTPNKDSADKDNSKLENNGNLLLPDGGTVTYPNGTNQELPNNSQITADGRIFVPVVIKLIDASQNKEIQAPAGYDATNLVEITQTADFEAAAPYINGYTFVDWATAEKNAQLTTTASLKVENALRGEPYNIITFNYKISAVVTHTITVVMKNKDDKIMDRNGAVVANSSYSFLLYPADSQELIVAAPSVTGQQVKDGVSQSKAATFNTTKTVATYAKVMADDTLTFTYEDTPSTMFYSLAFDSDGGTAITPVTAVKGTVVDLSKYTPTREKHTFEGWYSEKALTNKVTTITLDENKTVYAKWQSLFETEDHFAYMIGDAANHFNADKSMTRAEAAQMFYRLLKDKGNSTTNSFSDVSPAAWYGTAVSVLSNLGIIQGYPDKTYRPNNPIKRSEFAAIASRFDALSTSTKSFSDVTSTHWAYSYINSAATKGWINGYPDGTFRPDRNITRAEVVTVVNAVLGRKYDKTFIDAHTSELKSFSDLVANHWAYNDIMEAANAHDWNKDPITGAEASWKNLRDS